MSDVAVRPNTRLMLRDDQVEFDEVQVAALNQIGVKGADRADLAVFFHQCRRTGLDPFARQIYMIKRRQYDSELREQVDKQTIQTGIDGFRLIARRRDVNYSYQDTLWCGADGNWRDVWTDHTKPPYAAKVTVVLGNGKPVSAVANFAEYAATRKTNQGEFVLSGQWPSKPSLMIAKCAEALALRKAFPQDLSGIYTEDEMDKVDVIDAVPPAGVVIDPRENGGTGRDWEVEIAAATSAEAVRVLWRDCSTAKELNGELRAVFTARARDLAAAEAEAAA